jgi:hypothetical protein
MRSRAQNIKERKIVRLVNAISPRKVIAQHAPSFGKQIHKEWVYAFHGRFRRTRHALCIQQRKGENRRAGAVPIRLIAGNAVAIVSLKECSIGSAYK